MERRASALGILALTLLCAALGMFESASGVLTLTPFLILVLPLLAGFDPAGPAVVKLIGILGLDRTPGRGLPALPLGSATQPSAGRILARSSRPRGPPQAGFC